MTTDLRELLKEARDELGATLNVQASQDLKRLIERIDAALSEPVPSPRIRAWIRGHMSSYGGVSPPEYDEECAPGEDQPEGEGWLPLYTAPPPISPSEKK